MSWEWRDSREPALRTAWAVGVAPRSWGGQERGECWEFPGGPGRAGGAESTRAQVGEESRGGVVKRWRMAGGL